MSEDDIEVHPVQCSPIPGKRCAVPKVVTMLAYEVYCEVFGPQEAMVTGWCRGGFGASELIAFLYARSFPREQWKNRVNEAFKGMENL